MSSIDDLGDALQHLTGARQALARIAEADVDDDLTAQTYKVDLILETLHDKLARLYNGRREIER
jgi:hypothetical protein